jgi:hypothetical protein
MKFLRGSARAFDEGDEDEALRLATTIRILVHDTQRSRSVLAQLGAKDDLAFLDTSRQRPGAAFVIAHSGLAVLRMAMGGDASGTRYAAPLAEYDVEFSRGWVDFDTWWNRVVIDDMQGNAFTRSDLVLALAHKDGGAHVDPDLDEAYAALSRSNSLGWYVLESPDPNAGGVGITLGGAGSAGEPMGSPVPTNVRQVAFELDYTITETLADLLVDHG